MYGICVYGERNIERNAPTLANVRRRARTHGKTTQRIATEWLKSMVPFIELCVCNGKQRMKISRLKSTMGNEDRQTRIT